MGLLNKTVSTGTILLRRRESAAIKKLPDTPVTPHLVMIQHVQELRAMADDLEKAAQQPEAKGMEQAIVTYAQWRFVTDGWVNDMDACTRRCRPKMGAKD